MVNLEPWVKESSLFVSKLFLNGVSVKAWAGIDLDTFLAQCYDHLSISVSEIPMWDYWSGKAHQVLEPSLACDFANENSLKWIELLGLH